MSVSQLEVNELRREGQALRLDDVEHVFDTMAEVIGFLIYSARSLGADRPEQLRLVELLIRAVEMDRQDIVGARDTLTALHYGPDLSKLLTKLARKAQPKPQWALRASGGGGARVAEDVLPH